MGRKTGIEWCTATWNPWHGCTKVSPGCKHCYMFTEKERYGQDPTQVVRSKTTFDVPLKWREPARIFTCSWSDFFHEAADPWRPDAWEIIRQTPQHRYLILTKRADRIAQHLPWTRAERPWAHVALGVSVENADYEDRIEHLLNAPAALRFLSLEPLLGPIDLIPYLRDTMDVSDPELDAADGAQVHGLERVGNRWCRFAMIDWVIAGGESGKDARGPDANWVREIRDACQTFGTPFLFKQWGGRTAKSGGRILDGQEHLAYPAGILLP